MDFVSPLISLISCLTEPIVKRIGYVANVDENIRSLENRLKELKDRIADLETQMHQADLAGLTSTRQVKGWLERAKIIETEASLLIEHIGQPSQCFFCCNANCSSRCRLSGEVQQKDREITQHMEKMKMDPRETFEPPQNIQVMPCGPTIGLSVTLKRVGDFLREEDVGIIGIYGMGGVGKTTLLKEINNNFLKVAHDFDVVIWVLVSRDFVVERIQQVIGERLGLSWDGSEFQEQRASKLYTVLRRRNFVILLDDVWEGLDFEKIGIPIPDKENKCKVVFTTRLMDVCSDMDAHRKLRVEFLPEKESCELFYEKVGRSKILKSPSIRAHANTIIRKCGGLPLALITIGRAMANKESEKDWKHAVDMLNRSPSKIRGMEAVFSLLKFSFDNLDSTRKSCFLFCALFPEDYPMEREQLIEYWIGEGLLDGYHAGVHYIGHALIGSLKDACFLETGENTTQVKMHDVVRSFALWIASECGKNERIFLTLGSMGLTISPKVEEWERAQKISLIDNGITELSEAPFCPNLLTLLLQWNSSLSKISSGFFQSMPVLRVLDLSFTSLREIPDDISNLVELYHLDLSRTKLNTLPEGLGGLKKLRHLDLQRTKYLKTIPCQAISGLSQLRVLNLYYSYWSWEAQDTNVGKEVSFADLECLQHLTTLGITVTKTTTLEMLSSFNTSVNCLKYLYIKECNGLLGLQLLSPSSDDEGLRRLSIYTCNDLKYLTTGGEDEKNWLPNLEVLALHELPNMTTVWKNPVTEGCLQNLRSINIWHCNKLKNVSWVLRLPNLVTLYLFYCKEIEEVISGDEVVDKEPDAILCLRNLSIRDLPKLRSISTKAMVFRSLDTIALVGCSQLKKLPLKVSATSPPPSVYCSKEWWDRLEWDEEATKFAFLPHFMET